jgi:hypothetical protein
MAHGVADAPHDSPMGRVKAEIDRGFGFGLRFRCGGCGEMGAFPF